MAAKLGFEIVKQAMLKLLMKKGDDGIVLTLPKNEILDLNTRITMDRLIRNNIDPNSLTSPDQVINVLDNINNQTLKNAIPADTAQGKKITEMLFGKKGEVVDMTGKKIDTSQGIMGGKSVKELMESGQVQKGTDDIKISEKIKDREMFKNSNLNKKDSVTETISYIKTLEPMDAMKEANLVIGRKGKYKDLTPDQSKKILQDTEDHIFERDIPDEDFATGGRAGFYTGGITDVEPSLDDIGHGSDSLMSRTRLMSPGSQATTSTGLNYLLAEDNDNLRVPFRGGGLTPEDYLKVKDMLDHYHKYKRMGKPTISKADFAKEFFRENNAEGGRIGFAKGKLADAARRKFMKAAGAAGAGIAALKTGLLGFGKEAAPVVEKVAETVSETAQGVPPYFFKLVEKIKTMGDDVTPEYATKDRQVVKQYKDFELTEDVATGEQTIQRKKPSDFEYYDEQLYEDVYMNYKPGKGQADEATPRVADEYTEDTSYIRTSGPQKGEIFDTVDGVPDDVIEEGTMFEDNMTEFGKTKKADGGRIGFSKGKLVFENAKKFLEKVFGKENMAEMPNRDPEMYQGMLEVVDMFRNRDKEGLKKYLQKFLPHMDDAQVEDLIVGDAEDMAGLGKFGLGNLQGQLIRLGSGRDYASKIEAVKRLERNKSLKDLEVTEDMQRKPNASGGLAKMLGE